MNVLTLVGLLLLLGLLAGCKSTETPVAPLPTTTTPPVSTTVGTTIPVSSTAASSTVVSTTVAGGTGLGTFESNVHATSGTVQVVETGGIRTLVFTNFRTESGPDLRIYLAENTSLRNFIEVSRLDKTGNFTVELPATANPTQQRYVLIWCKAFSVLFGNAELK